MSQRNLTSLYWGVGLLVVGAFFTFFTFGLLAPYVQELVWGATVILALAGVGFLTYVALRPQRWWYLIPGFLLVGMASVVYLGAEGMVEGSALVAIVFGALALAHLIIFLMDREERWWAWIAAGSFLILTVVLALGARLDAALMGPVLFAGLALVFYLLYLFLPARVQRWWALALATTLAITAAFTFTVTVGTESVVARFWPVVVFVAGVAVLAWTVARLFAPAQPTVPAPAPGAEAPPVPEPLGEVLPVTEPYSEEEAPPAEATPQPEPMTDDLSEAPPADEAPTFSGAADAPTEAPPSPGPEEPEIPEGEDRPHSG